MRRPRLPSAHEGEREEGPRGASQFVVRMLGQLGAQQGDALVRAAQVAEGAGQLDDRLSPVRLGQAQSERATLEGFRIRFVAREIAGACCFEGRAGVIRRSFCGEGVDPFDDGRRAELGRLRPDVVDARIPVAHRSASGTSSLIVHASLFVKNC